jgi:hypothetical protein
VRTYRVYAFSEPTARWGHINVVADNERIDINPNEAVDDGSQAAALARLGGSLLDPVALRLTEGQEPRQALEIESRMRALPR